MKKQTPLTSYEAVKEKALRLLEFRSHSEYELTQKLRRCGAADEHIEMTLDFCRRYGFVNDESFANRKVRDLFHLKKFGIRRIRSEMKMLGIADEYTEAAIASLDADESRQALYELAKKKLRGDFSDKNRDKCIRFLIYRGYSIYEIKDVIQEIQLEVQDEI